MQFADGMEEAMRLDDGFASDAEAAAFWSGGAPDVVAIQEVEIPGAGGQIQRGRLYRSDDGAPVLIYIHGGGWSGGSVALNEASARGLAAASGWNVLAISYRLARRTPIPPAWKIAVPPMPG